MLRPKNNWDKILCGEFTKPYFCDLEKKIDDEYKNFVVFPPADLIFSALDSNPLENVKVVILGQDPYHGDNQANGMAFAVNEDVVLPPSLVNIFTEIENEYGARPNSGTLKGWAEQGVLLLNTSLTVRKATPQSHSAFGWQIFTDAVVKACSNREKPMVFILWGSNAISKKQLIAPHHLTLTAPHPSPLSAYRGFFGCAHFKKANEFLTSCGQEPIDWLDTAGSMAKYYNAKGKICRI